MKPISTRSILLGFLQQQNGPISFDVIRAEFSEKVFSTYELKAALWELLADDFLELTPSRKIVAISTRRQ